MRYKVFFSLVGGMPFALMAFSTGPPPHRTGAPADGGGNCTACHRTYAPANSDPRGSVSIDVSNYTPGVKQTIHISVKHPEAARWGFQLTARLVSDETKTAGTLSPTDPAVVKIICDDGSARGGPAPCNGKPEFAEHVSAPRTDPGAGFTFDIDWTPPAEDAGDVVFYFAGNAANGDGTPNGDRIYTSARAISPVGACSGTKAPAIQSISNAASFTNAVAAGECWMIKGLDFQPPGKTRGAGLGDIVNSSYPRELSCVAVEVNGQRAPILYVQQDQINLQAPAISGAGPVSVTVVLNPGLPNEVRSNPATVTVQTVAPAFFTWNGTSIIAQIAGTAQAVADPSVLAGAHPAKPGDLVTLYGTGFGPTDPAVDPGALAPGAAKVTGAVSVTIGGVTLAPEDVQYIGLVPTAISALYQVNVRIPAATPDGDIPVVLSIGAAQTQSGATIPVKSGT